MINSINRITYTLASLPLIEKLGGIDKAYTLALAIFKGGSGLFFLGYGAKELAFDARQLPKGSFNKQNLLELQTDQRYAQSHGTLFMAAGTASILECLQLFSLIQLGDFITPVSLFGTGLFLFANFVALEQNIHLFLQGKEKLSRLASEEGFLQIKSAVLGMISNLGYIMATAIAVIGGSAAIALLIGCIGACFGALKIFYDFYILYKDRLNSIGLGFV